MKKLLLILSAFIYFISYAQQDSSALAHQFQSEDKWVDSVYLSLNQTERIAQLLMVRANNAREDYFPEISNYIKKYKIGGVCYFGSGAAQQAIQNNAWQEISDIPLLTAIDGEWGLGMRLDSTISFPYQMTLGAIQNDSLIFEMGQEIGKQCRRIGLHINFAPVVDININPKNPVINSRSFGDDPEKVAEKGLAYLKGLQSENILASAKHFPGHGDTGSDSHKTLPIINHSYKRLDSLELVPFKKLINNGLNSVMIAHLYIPALEDEENLASTLSPKIVNGLLRDSLQFKGLVITDALDMQGVTKYFSPGEIEVRALLAGNDLLLLPKDVPLAISSILKAVEKGRIDENYLEEKVKKILRFKYKSGLANNPKIELNDLAKDLNNPKAIALNQQLYEESTILLSNNNLALPFLPQSKQKTAVLTIQLNAEDQFLSSLKRFSNLDSYSLKKGFTKKQSIKVKEQLRDYDQIIIALGDVSIFPYKNFRVSEESKEIIDFLAKRQDVIFSFFGSPIAYRQFLNLDPLFSASIIAHQDNEYTAKSVAQQLFGALPFLGKLPIRLSQKYINGYGLEHTLIDRLGFALPEQMNVDSEKLQHIDSIVYEGIEMQAFPGCQVVVAKEGRIIYSKSFGFQTYDRLKPINGESIYDIASITKIAATVASLMKLQAANKFDPNDSISNYLPYLKKTNKENMIISEILMHQAQLWPWIPFYLDELDSLDVLKSEYLRTKSDENHAVRLAQNLYIDNKYAQKIYDTIAKSELWKWKEYRYSDLGFYWFKQIIELQSHRKLEDFVEQEFYQPMGLKNIHFLPRQHFSIDRIVPTEYDSLFRKQLIRGDVHDPGAAMLGGVGGHAGLFSNAEDLTAVFQLFLQNGHYAGLELLDSAIIQEYTNPINTNNSLENRRALGFDKPYAIYDPLGPVCESASVQSYGHLGFTGTYAWADPVYGLVYIFLSNRVYPDASNNKISKYDFRTRIHQAIYDAIKD